MTVRDCAAAGRGRRAARALLVGIALGGVLSEAGARPNDPVAPPSSAPAPVATVPVGPPSPPPEGPPTAEWIQWNVIGDVQGDAALATSAPSDHVDAAALRRARLSVVADLFFNWRLRASGDFGKYRGLRDLSLEYRGGPLYIALGRMIEPFALLQGGSSGAALMERPQALALGPGYGLGVQANYARDAWAFTLGSFKATQNDVEWGGRKENATTARVTAAPLRGDTGLLHVGLSASQRESGEGFLQFDALPETTLLEGYDTQSAPLYADPQGLTPNKYWIFGGELAGELGPVLLEGEYLKMAFSKTYTVNPNTFQVEQITPPPFNGYYVEASWVVTGERRDYSARHGMFGNVFPAKPLGTGGAGAVEVAARYSHTDLHWDVPYFGLTGDVGDVASLGTSWYPVDAAKVMLEFLHLKRDARGGTGGTQYDPTNPNPSEWIVQARLQWYFVWP